MLGSLYLEVEENSTAQKSRSGDVSAADLGDCVKEAHMRLVIKKVSNREYEKTVDVESIQDLLRLCDAYGNDIIVKQPRSSDGEYSLLVYDDYLE